jgi:phosphoribosylaminoimidazole-succinocarboxamide synthase
MTFDEVVAQEGAHVAERLRALTLEIYTQGAKRAAESGVIIADTKLEFGWNGDVLTLGDEVLTSDSSRSGARRNGGRAPAEGLRQAVRPRLEHDHRRGPNPARTRGPRGLTVQLT